MEAFDIVRWNKERYARDQKELQTVLEEASGTLRNKIEMLHGQQSSIGFIRDALDQVTRTRLVRDPFNRNSESFLVQYNPVRELRRQGAGRKSPPEGYKSINGGCFLCTQNIEWQQYGLEMSYEFSVNEGRYAILCNPFPFMPMHVTIASKNHEPQTWLEGDPTQDPSQRLGRIIRDLLTIVGQTPECIGLYNGVNAGASIPLHRHYHLFSRIKGSEPFAIEKLAQSKLDRRTNPPFCLDEYPIISVFFHGDIDMIVRQAVEFYEAWEESCGSSLNISANIIATISLRPHAEKKFDVYFVPRNQQFSISLGRSEVVGGLEVMGEIALSKPEEYARIKEGTLSYDAIVTMLKSVEAPEAASLIEALSRTLYFGRRSTDR